MTGTLLGIWQWGMVWAALSTPWNGEPPRSAVPAPDLKAVGFDQRLDVQVPADLAFVEESGREVRLGEYFRGRPVILVLAYYRCPMLCTLVLRQLIDTMQKMPLVLGRDYDVVTVSFDPREKPALAAAKRQRYLDAYGHPEGATSWHFLTGTQEAIERLTKTVGFRYVYDAKQDQFIHASGLIVLTPQGRTSRYLYGVEYPARDLRLALVEASDSKIGSPVEQVLLYCFHYDPKAGKYSASVMNFVRAGGVLTIVVVGLFVWLVVALTRRHRTLAATVGNPPPGAPPPVDSERAES